MKGISRNRSDNPIERVTGALVGINSNHQKVHDKKAYSLSGSITVAAGNVGAIQIDVPDDRAASLAIDMTNALADLTYTATAIGLRGNLTTVAHINPGAEAPLSVVVTGTDIVVNLAVNAGAAITSTAAQVAAAIAANADAAELVTCAAEGDGSGVVNAVAETALAGGNAKAYVHFQAASITATSGPCSVSILEDYAMDATAAAIAADLTPINHHRARPVQQSTLAVTAYLDVAAEAGDIPVTLGTLTLPGASTGQVKVSSESGEPEEKVLAQGVSYLVAFSNADDIAVTFGYNLFWYEEDAA